jgi:hypothetical protein
VTPRNLGWFSLAAVAFAAGCAFNPAPDESLAVAHKASERASRLEASRLRSPPLAIASDYQPVRWWVERSAVDAELAQLKAISARARKVAAEATAQFRREGAAYRASL